MTHMPSNTYDQWLRKVTNSALWAAYGDALGFTTEMANSETVQYRTGLTEVSSLIGWKRKIGGRYGVSVNLPSGCYSDDTQLRLSVSRAIGHDGYFDVDSFAHIELPVWMSYQLGGGLGTNLAAKNLSKRSVGWATNFFKSKESSYVKGGGNGAAMRI
ncbi:ADP-ribosylglycohydrolase family protein, partial [Humidesulfovibrio sp.]|uniref:ADP-ribosylglycohydrolase family protein n=1 Tax=Humidesulfovibrio sp. TaxID=2910988 RepID=UPI00280B2044